MSISLPKVIFTLTIGSLLYTEAVIAAECKTQDGVLIATVRSEGQPQQGQNHRSSGNFSTEKAIEGFSKYCWVISDTKEPNSIKFNVKRDKSAGTDPVEYTDLTNGSVTEIKQERSMYIADPKGTYGGDFTVSVYAVN